MKNKSEDTLVQEAIKKDLIDRITWLVEYEDGRRTEIREGLVRKDMGRTAQIIILVNHILEKFEAAYRAGQEDGVKEFYSEIANNTKDIESHKLKGIVITWRDVENIKRKLFKQ